MNHFFGLHGRLEFNNIDRFKSEIDLIKKSGLKTIWLSGATQALTNHSTEIHQLIQASGLALILESTVDIAHKLEATAIVTRHTETIQNLVAQHNTFQIGFITDQIADCKNAELLGADFIYLGPLDQIGATPYQTIAPKDEAYEWLILNCNTPIFAFGQQADFDIESLIKASKLSGLALPPNLLENQTNLTLTFGA